MSQNKTDDNIRFSKGMIKRLWNYTRPVRPLLFWGSFLNLLAVAGTLLTPFCISQILNHYTETPSQIPVMYWVLFYGLGILITGLLLFWSFRILGRCAALTARNIEREAFEHLQRLPLSYFDHMPVGTVVSRVVRDSLVLENLYSTFLSNLAKAILRVIGVWVTLFFLDRMLFLISIVILPIASYSLYTYQKKVKEVEIPYRKAYAELSGVVNEALQGAEIVAAFNRADRKEQQLIDESAKTVELGFRKAKLSAFFIDPFLGLLRSFMFFLSLLYFFVAKGHLGWVVSAGTVYLFLDYTVQLVGNIENLIWNLGVFQRSAAAADHVFELLDEKTVTHRDGELDRIKGSVRLDHLCFHYVESQPVLRDVSLDIEENTTVAFVGRTGSGKSTLTSLLFGFYAPESGHIYFDGMDQRDLPIYALREQMAIVLQEPFLFKASLHDNIALYDEKLTEEKTRAALEAVGGASMINRSPEGMQLKIDEKGRNLSQGERQLISFARALVRDPRILILDEATSSIDTETEQQIRRAIEVLGQGRTMIIVAHRLSTIQDADQIFVLEKGRVVEQGRHEELLAQKGYYAEMARHQKMDGEDLSEDDIGATSGSLTT